MRTPTGGFVLAISGAIGFVFGIGYADWQWAVEHAQVIAGLVAYPPDSPVAIAHAKLSSLTSQAGAVLLWLGVSEIALSKLLSGVLGLVSFQALAAIVYALSRDAILAIGSVFVIFISRVFDYGPVYPIELLGTAHTHGAIGLSVGVLAAGLLGMGWYRSGGFLVALAPAVHLALGTWMAGVAALAVLAGDAATRTAVRGAWKAIAAGAALAAASVAIHRMLATSVVPIDAAEADRYLRAFVPFWDGHRQAVDLLGRGVRISAGLVVIAIAGLVLVRRVLPAAGTLLLRVVAIGGALGLALAVWSSAWPATLPDVLLLAMPGRMLNVSVFMAGAVLFGLAGALRPAPFGRTLLVVQSAGLIVCSRSALWELAGVRPWRLDPLAVLTIASLGLLAAMWWVRRAARTPADPPAAARAMRAAVVVLLSAAAVISTIRVVREAGSRAGIFRDRTHDPVLAAASKGEGPLLTGGELFLIQLRTRRPVLLDGGTLDTLPYALEAGPAMQRIQTTVYGVDLFNPPPEARGGGRIPHDVSRRVWERYALEDWQRIGRQFGVSQVLVPGDWRIGLPAIETSAGLALYAIPK